MLTAADCTHRAEECRKLAKLAPRAEDWGHFVEMAETWELLAKQREEMLAKQREQENQLAQTVALAESIANDRGPTTYPKKAA